MSTVDKVIEKTISLTHLLLIGPTKYGKTDYCVQCAIDGFNMIYVDGDNGLATIKERLKDNPAAMSRIHYFNPKSMVDFMKIFLDVPVFRYNERTGERVSTDILPTDTIAEIVPSLIPPNVIFALDSWTSLTFESIKDKAAKLEVDLLEVDKYGREIYGPTGFQATHIALGLQRLPFHCIVQAHSQVFERKEKVPGMMEESSKEKNMVIKETQQIPVSTSGPHGFTMGKHFNQIGWMTLDPANQRRLDFTVKAGRLGGGTPNSIGDPRTTHSFKTLFGGGMVESKIDPERPWIRYMTGDEYAAEAAERRANAPRLGANGKLIIPGVAKQLPSPDAK